MNEQTDFLFNLDGLIKGHYITMATDSTEAIIEVIKLMDSQSNGNTLSDRSGK